MTQANSFQLVVPEQACFQRLYWRDTGEPYMLHNHQASKGVVISCELYLSNKAWGCPQSGCQAIFHRHY
jgi:hypothetical protein